MATREEFVKELERVINHCSQENGSNTPDFIIAEYLVSCLHAWNAAVTRREEWYGRGDAAIPASQLIRP